MTKSVDRPKAAAKRERDDPARAEARIARTVRAIPAGSVSSYGEIATRAGLPGRARLVGHVLGAWEGDALPWHRVLRSDGRIAFPPGSASFRRQVRLLAAEGVLVVNRKVDLAAHGWDRNLDQALWAPPPAARKSRKRAPKR
jgi:methylated-DNA-protein-cysteine methyltransferase-like protein